jgi:peptidylprolyl isomerase
MKHSVLILLLAASTVAASAQTSATQATPAAKPATTTAKPTTPVAKPAAPSAKPATTAAAKLPLGVPAPGIPAVKTIKKTAFSLQYQEKEIGTGAVAEPNMLYKVLYTGWLAADGRKFDSSDDHRQPLRDKDGKPVMGNDGQPKLDVPQPMPFPQGMGRVIPGFDQGFEGMKIGGKRRIFIPWQLAYGAKGRPGPDAAHPGIPPKADLIFDVELVDVSELPAPPQRPPMGGMRPMPHPGAPPPGAPGAPPQNIKLPTLGTAPKPPAAGAAPNAAVPSTPATNASPAPATAPKPAAPAATAPAPSSTPAAPTAPQPK